MISSSSITKDKLQQLPVEITREIFSHLLTQHKNANSILSPGGATCKLISGTSSINKFKSNHRHGNDTLCMCWQLDLLSVAMVCKSWYAIAVEVMRRRQGVDPWLPFLNYAGHQRSYPFRSRLAKLMAESRLENLIFHHLVRHLVIDFASFDTIRREKTKNNIMVKRKVHNSIALADLVQLLKLCTNTQRLDIICDAGFVTLLSQNSSDNNSIVSTVSVLEQQLMNSKIKRLDLIGFNPIQRCPCCAGRDWDKYLSPLIRCLSLDILVLQHVLPSAEVFETIAEQKNLKRIVLYKSLITIPESQLAISASNGTGYKRRGSGEQQTQQRTNSISRIPKKLWDQITSISIYEDMEDASTWPSRRYLYDLVEHVGPQLEEFTLQFGTKEENEASLLQLDVFREDNLVINDPTSILHKLKEKCKDSLRLVSLVNVPEYQPIR